MLIITNDEDSSYALPVLFHVYLKYIVKEQFEILALVCS